MMKFKVNSIASCASRLGSIRDVERLSGAIFETPFLLLYTKGGSIPHLTREVLDMVIKSPLALHMPLSSSVHCHEAVKEFKKGIAEFVGLKESLVYCAIHDTVVPTPQGFNEKESIALWSRYGKQPLSADKYMDIVESFQPDMYQALCDGNTNISSSKKRVQKAVDRSQKLHDKCLERHKDSKVLQKSGLIGMVEGGYNIVAREKSAKHLALCPVLGFVIDGLHNNGPEVEHLSLETVGPVIEATVKYLPADKIRIIHGCWNPAMVLELVSLGIDAFDSSYTYLVTERGGALIFKNTLETDTSEENTSIPYQPEEKVDLQQEKELQDCNASDTRRHDQIQKENNSKTDKTKQFELSLSDERYMDDFTPISKKCICLTCQNHTKAYIHHLLRTHELLAPVLLSIHNIHHYIEFFKSIRKALECNSLDTLKRNVNQEIHK